MRKIKRLLRYDWPLHFVLLFTNWLPDNIPFLRLRGFLANTFFKKCGKNLRLGRNLVFYNPSEISIGSDVYIGYGSWFSAGDTITIEDQVTLGPYCVIASSNHQRMGKTYFASGSINLPVCIRNGCWFGSHCVVTAGCEIGSGSLIAAGAVVTDSFPQNVMLGGVPAKVIKTLE